MATSGLISEHGIFIDHLDNVWLGGSGGEDAQILKFTKSGDFLLQIGAHGQGQGSNDTANFGQPAEIDVDPETNEVIIADGYGNRRVAIFDADTGEYKRHWGAYGNVPTDDPYTYGPRRRAVAAVRPAGPLRDAVERRPAVCL